MNVENVEESPLNDSFVEFDDEDVSIMDSIVEMVMGCYVLSPLRAGTWIGCAKYANR